MHSQTKLKKNRSYKSPGLQGQHSEVEKKGVVLV